MDPAHVAALLLSRKTTEVDLEALQQSEADRLLAEIVDQRVRLRACRDTCLQFGKGGMALALAAEASIRACLQFEAQLLAPILGQRLQANDISNKVTRIERVIVESAAIADEPVSAAFETGTVPRPEPPAREVGTSPEAPRSESTPLRLTYRPTQDNVCPLVGRYSQSGG